MVDVPPTSHASLEPAVQTWLLHWARRSIRAASEGARMPTASDIPQQAEQKRGCFVSLHTLKGALRGCIGTFSEHAPLWRQVHDMGVAAATNDPRFSPLRPDELGSCRLEISVLSPRVPATPEQIEVGIHGVWVARGNLSGVLLPQVPLQHGWDRETFLEHTCLKAGLPRAAWRDGSVELCSFTAEIFAEIFAEIGEDPQNVVDRP